MISIQWHNTTDRAINQQKMLCATDIVVVIVDTNNIQARSMTDHNKSKKNLLLAHFVPLEKLNRSLTQRSCTGCSSGGGGGGGSSDNTHTNWMKVTF